MVENRFSERHLVLRTAKIIPLVGLTDSFDCAILNVSTQGACILIPTNANVPDEFALVIDGETVTRPCTVAWKAGARVGVSFGLTHRT
jgi:hypothetical protein